ncbi:MSHA biogenesis protein MshG [Oceanisphaera profunda]|uniref:MSHA biogenesis protein MshG n=1 Tax=Oceanisphaera profunda TaxID=1416627 RepID=A0A1Y0D192_9GAMM|nr:type II secretion system F family protein [Oceanisphaera profunda]ART81292.1 MSHA biogenesis protein MshG [Oceanisphaera profunda]
MAFFQYRARNARGQLNQGRLEAASAQAAADSLMSAGLIPVEIKEAKASATASINWQQFLRGKVKLEALLILCRQFSSLTRAGIPILRIVEGLRDTTDNKLLINALNDVSEALNQGQTLANALAAHPHIFNSLFISLVDVGESTGQLEQAFLQLSHYFQLELDTRRRVKAATRYPMFVSLAMLAAMVVVNIYVIPAFTGIFASMGSDLPLMTRILIGSSEFFTTYIVHLVLGLAALGFAIWRYVKTKNGQLRWHTILLRIPIIGPLVNRILLARFCRSFSMMLGAGVPIVRVLTLAGTATGNAYLTRAILGMGDELASGNSLSRVATDSGVFTPLILQMFKVGEETGRVDQMVMEAGKFYEEEVDYDITNLTSKIEPILIVVISAMVLVLALGIFTPMWDMVGLVNQ